MAVKHRKWWKAMQPRRDMIEAAGKANDLKLLETLGSAEQYAWHEGRKLADPDHRNPYKTEDRKKERSR